MLGNAPIGGAGSDRKRKMYTGPQRQHQQQQQMPQMMLMMQQQQSQIGNNGHLMQQPPPMAPMPAIGAAPGAAAGVGGPAAVIGGAGACVPTCVLFVSEIPQNTCELELKRVFQEFGKIEQIVTVPSKGQAFVEYLRVSDAERLIAMCQSGFIVTANGGNLTVCFSNRPRLEPAQESFQSATPQTCLLLSFYNVRMDFNCESIRQICSPYGIVDRCLLVRQPDGLMRAVLEFEKLEDAVLTKPNLNGANMYAGCNAIKCEYARHTAFEYFASRYAVLEEYRYEAQGPADPMMMMMGGAHGGKRPRLPQQPQQAPLAGPAGLQQQQAVISGIGMLSAIAQQQQQKQGQKAPGPSEHCVVVIRGLSSQMNCDRLFNILALYGNVGRIKFVTSREGFALVQMLDASSAQQAVDFLHGQTVLGGTLKVTHSTQGAVKSNSKEFTLADGSPAEKSFEMAKLNRFMSQDAVARNQASIGRTGRVLYYWGCADGTSEKDIREALKQAGTANPIEVSPQNEKGSTGWITFANASDATDAICLANHSQISDNSKLKLTYAVNKRDR